VGRKSNIGPLPPARRRRPPRKPFIKKYSRRPRKPPFHIYEILKWADAHCRRTGRWPIANSGPIHEAPWDDWRTVDDALRQGYRGCRPGGSLAKLLYKYRGKRPQSEVERRPRVSVTEVLAWADKFHRRTGIWPTRHSGRVGNRHNDTWSGLDHALQRGTRGLPASGSLALLLMRERGVRRSTLRPRLTLKQILGWADAYHQRHGRWPSARTGAVEDAPAEDWKVLHYALHHGHRGLPAGYTLATLLAKYRGKRVRKNLPRFSEARILEWADAYHRRHGRWPSLYSGPIPEGRPETWRVVESALNHGLRGLPGGDSLSRLLVRAGRRPYVNRNYRPPRQTRLTIPRILAWADTFHRRHGRWPAPKSGPIEGVLDEIWGSVDNALRIGLRGLGGGSSIALLLEQQRGWRHQRHRPLFSVPTILAWADAHFGRAGRWPSCDSGPIPESAGDTWAAVDSALRSGRRGLPGGDSIGRLLSRNGRGAAGEAHAKRPRPKRDPAGAAPRRV
jgi:hypothetical protein